MNSHGADEVLHIYFTPLMCRVAEIHKSPSGSRFPKKPRLTFRFFFL